MGRVDQLVKASLEHWEAANANPAAACLGLWIQPCYKALDPEKQWVTLSAWECPLDNDLKSIIVNK